MKRSYKNHRCSNLFIHASGLFLLVSGVVATSSIATNHTLTNISNKTNDSKLTTPENRINSVSIQADEAEASVFFSCKESGVVPEGKVYYTIADTTKVTIVTGTTDEGTTLNTVSGTDLILRNNFNIGTTTNCNVVAIESYAFCNDTDIVGEIDISNLSSSQMGTHIFDGCTNITSAILPNSVKSLSDYTFNKCTNLSSVTFANDITSIGAGCFYSCTNLNDIDFGSLDSLDTIDTNAFYRCTKFTEIDLENCDALTTIGSYAFYDCWNVASITIPDRTTLVIGANAFGRCSDLTDVTIPANMTTIPESMFAGCTSLVKVNFLSQQQLTTINTSAFSGCYNLKEITLPDSVTNINTSAFVGCSGFTTFTFPANLQSVGSYAFSGCTGITSLDFSKCTDNFSFGVGSFYGCTNLANPNLPSKLSDIGSSTFYNCKKLTEINLSQCTNIDAIGSGCFNNCIELASVILPNNITAIGGNAFYGCTKLSSFNFGTGITSIGMNAFYQCISLVNIDLSKCTGLTTIGDDAFKECLKLNSVALPSSASSNDGLTIGESAFENDSKLSKINFPSHLSSIGDYAFKNCASITSFDLTKCANLENIGVGSFEGCDVSKIKFEGNSNIRWYAFTNGKALVSSATLSSGNWTASTTALGSVAFGDIDLSGITNLTEIAQDAFYKCTEITSLKLPNSIENINAQICYECTNLSSVNFSDLSSLQTIDLAAFRNCVKLTDANLSGTTLKTIGSYAFDGCINLSSVTLPQTLETINSDAFAKCNLKSISLDSKNENFMLYAPNSNKSGLIVVDKSTGWTDTSIVAGCLACGDIDFTNDDCTTIAAGAFAKCYGITSFTAGSELTKIESSAFNQCENLTAVDLSAARITKIGDGAFANCDLKSINFINYGSSTYYLYQTKNGAAIVRRDSLNGTEWSDLTTVVGCLAYGEIDLSNCTKLTTIYAQAFVYCGDITGIILPKSVQTIEQSAFKGCEHLSSVSLNEGLTTINKEAFYGCGSLKEISIPSSVVEIASKALANCPLQKIHFTNTDPNWMIGINEDWIDINYWLNDLDALPSITLAVPNSAKKEYQNYINQYPENCTWFYNLEMSLIGEGFISNPIAIGLGISLGLLAFIGIVLGMIFIKPKKNEKKLT